jgi:hypothetical protein
MKKNRLKKFAVEFYNNLLKENTELVVEAYKKDEAVEIATLQIDAFKSHWSDELAEDYMLKKVSVIS